ncbi:MAG: hypothetical protein AB1449_13675 [Chloroflexota bacterium]
MSISSLERLSRNTVLMVSLVVIWLLLYIAALLYVQQAALPSAVLLVLAIAAVAGLVPGSCLTPWLDRMARAAARGKSGIVVLLAVASPSLLTTFGLLFAYWHWSYQQFAFEYGLDLTRVAVTLPLSVIAASIGLLFLGLNLWAMTRPRSGRDAPRG